MAEVMGVKETKELLVGVNELSIELIKHFKDGIQVADALAIVDDFKTNPDLLAAIMAAKDNIQAVPAEVKDLSLAEGIELALAQAAYVPKLIAAAAKA